MTTFSYVDTGTLKVITTQKITDALNAVSEAYPDALGRTKETRLTSNPDGVTYVDITYDGVGRKATVSNPVNGGPCSVDSCRTTFNYDALSRAIKEIPPDGSSSTNNVQTAYGLQNTGSNLGITVTVTDQASKQRESISDAQGRLIEVLEPDPSSGSLVNETDYFYDTVNNLTCVQQQGSTSSTGCSANPSNDATSTWRIRRSTYDSLSRLLTAKNPESGTITWTYDVDSNVITKTDARGITINYNYDQLHRVATTGTGTTQHAKYYTNQLPSNDPPVDYYFDQTNYNTLAIAEGFGHMTGMADATGVTAWSYDPMGRTYTEKRTLSIVGLTASAVTKTIDYRYNYDGSLKTLQYPEKSSTDSTRKTITYTPSAAGRATEAKDVANSINYVTAATYAPHGALSGYVNGGAITSAWTYNNRLQPQDAMATTGVLDLNCSNTSGKVMHLNYNFASGGINNGTLLTSANCRNSSRTTNFKYDYLNRILLVYTSAWADRFTTDIWGNLAKKDVCLSGDPCYGEPYGEYLNQTADVANRFSGFSYDSSGNMLNDQLPTPPGHAYSYDAENRPYSAASVTYYYNGMGERVAKSSGKLYFLGSGSGPIVETDTNGTISTEFIFFNGKRVARRDNPSGSVHYYFADQIGSANVITNANGTTIESESDFYPYGGERIVVTDTTGNQYKFSGKERDTETTMDYFGARFYSSNYGRFLTADWTATPSPTPFANINDPQSFNLYSYVENNPTTGIDPDGHAPNNPCIQACPGEHGSAGTGHDGGFFDSLTDNWGSWGNIATFSKLNQTPAPTANQSAKPAEPVQSGNFLKVGFWAYKPVPASAGIVSVTLVPATSGAYYQGLDGAYADVTYQVLDQKGFPFTGAALEPREDIPKAGISNGLIGGPFPNDSSLSTPTTTLPSGQFRDVPLGFSTTLPQGTAKVTSSVTQTIHVDFQGSPVTLRTNTLTFTATPGHGSVAITNTNNAKDTFTVTR